MAAYELFASLIYTATRSAVTGSLRQENYDLLAHATYSGRLRRDTRRPNMVSERQINFLSVGVGSF